MKKQEQIAINNDVLCAIDYYNQELALTGDYHNTMVAFTINSVMYDFLRYVYGYTATSAKHIAKFRKFTKPTDVLTYRPV